MNAQTQSTSNPFTIISPPLRRAKIHSLSRQRVVLCLDGSGSMQDQNKAQDTFAASLGLCQELALLINKDAFEIAVIRFADTAELVHPLQKASSLVGHLRPLEADGGTNLTSALELADRILTEAARPIAPQAIRYVRPLTVVMSDGRHNTGPSPIPAAAALKRSSDLLTVAFGDDADEEMLRAIATEQLSVRCRAGADLRCYFAEVGRTLTVTCAAGINAATALATPQQ
jgi:Mg-chelatase subunit ChlD